MSIKKNAQPITTLDDWLSRAGPKRGMQWKDGRSAKEAARAWLSSDPGSLPKEVESLLTSHPSFGTPHRWEAEPEARLRFDRFLGEPRNSDLLVVASDTHGDYVIAVEAKADEPFGEPMAKALANAVKRKEANARSNAVLRIQQLQAALLGTAQHAGEFDPLRYQLLTATAGVLAEAERQGVDRAVMLVHEFITDQTRDDKHRANARDLDRFAQRLSGDPHMAIHENRLAGPFEVPGAPLCGPMKRLFIGKAVRRLRGAGASVG